MVSLVAYSHYEGLIILSHVSDLKGFLHNSQVYRVDSV